MVSTINFNPFLTTTAGGGFSSTLDGLVQGTAMQDPAARFSLAGGILSTSDTLPMWGGVGITEALASGTGSPTKTQGGTVSRAASLTGSAALTGFTVFDQNSSMINTPQSPVPLAAAGMGVMFYRLGSDARIVVGIDPALVSLEGGIISPQVSWDFALQRLVPYVAAYPANVITAASWAAGVLTYTTTSAHGLSVGSDFTITGMTPSGYNGTFTATAGTTGSTIKAALATNPGTSTVQGTLVAGGGALACKVLDIQIGNSMTVSYDPVTGFATWNRAGSAALILI